MSHSLNARKYHVADVFPNRFQRQVIQHNNRQ